MWPWITTDPGLTCKHFNHTTPGDKCHRIYITDTTFSNFNPLKRILVDPCATDSNPDCIDHESKYYFASGFVLAV